MKFVLEVKPSQYVGETKSQLIKKVQYAKGQDSSIFYKTVNGIKLSNCTEKNGCIIVSTKFNKANKKTKQKKVKNKKQLSFNGIVPEKITSSSEVRPSYWYCNVYQLPLALLAQYHIVSVENKYNGSVVLTTRAGVKLNHRFEEIPSKFKK